MPKPFSIIMTRCSGKKVQLKSLVLLSTALSPSLSPFPVAPPQGVEFLRSLVNFYTTQQMRHDNEIEKDVDFEEESGDDSVSALLLMQLSYRLILLDMFH